MHQYSVCIPITISRLDKNGSPEDNLHWSIHFEMEGETHEEVHQKFVKLFQEKLREPKCQ